MIDKILSLDGPEMWLLITCLMLIAAWAAAELQEIMAMRRRRQRREAYARYCEMIDAERHGNRQ